MGVKLELEVCMRCFRTWYFGEYKDLGERSGRILEKCIMRSSIICNFTKHNYNQHIKEDEMGGACRAYGKTRYSSFEWFERR
jgi:hypothetical protein